MTTFQIQTFNGSIQNQSVQLVNARELHEILNVQTPFHKWISRRIEDYNFAENLDFIGVDKFVRTEAGFFGMREKEVKEYHITLDMAKELCMLERSELGQQARRYFIAKEKQAQQLVLEHQALVAKIPPFLLSNPDTTLRLIEQAQTALFLAYPECKEIVRYRNMGLTTVEISKLLGVGKTTVERRLSKLFELGVLVRKQVPNGQLGLALL